MATDEQFSLCWNNFHSNMSAGFHGLLSRGDLVDVTLAAEGRLVQAHKLVLSVCSPLFQEMFKINSTQHPIVFLKDVSHSVLKDLLQFMYQGEVNVKQEELASFISTAEQLQIKGLTGNQNEDSTASKPKPTAKSGPRLSQQLKQKFETDLETKTSTPVAVKRPKPPLSTNNTSAPVKRKCMDPLEAGPSGIKQDFVTITDDDEHHSVAPKTEPEFVNEAMWDEDDEGANNDESNYGEEDSNMEMQGFENTGDSSNVAEGSAVGDAQGMKGMVLQHYTIDKDSKSVTCNLCEKAMSFRYSNLYYHLRTKHPYMYNKIQRKKLKSIKKFRKGLATTDYTSANEGDSESTSGESEGPKSTAGTTRKISWVWKYAIRLDDETCMCKICATKIRVPRWSSANVSRHIKKKHADIISSSLNDDAIISQLEIVHVDVASLGIDENKDEAEQTDVDKICKELMSEEKTRSSGYKRKSWIWKYFKNTDDKSCFVCQVCHETIKFSNKSTGNLLRHFKRKHSDIFIYFTEKSQQDNNVELEKITINNDSIKQFSNDSSNEDCSPDNTTNIEIGKGNKKKSWAWKYFNITNDKSIFMCKICDKIIKYSNNSTGNLIRHVKNQHSDISIDFTESYRQDNNVEQEKSADNENTEECSEHSSDEGSKKRSWIWKYFDKTQNKQGVVCQLCHNVIKLSNSSSGNLNRHFKLKHFDIYISYTSSSKTDISAEQEKSESRWVWKCFSKVSEETFSCDTCQVNVDIQNGSSYNLRYHVKTEHHELYMKYVKKPDIELKKTMDDKSSPEIDSNANTQTGKEVYAGQSKEDSEIVKMDIGDEKECDKWIWKLFSRDQENCYKCYVCNHEVLKSTDTDNDIKAIFDHLRSEHSITSSSQIVLMGDCDDIIIETFNVAEENL